MATTQFVYVYAGTNSFAVNFTTGYLEQSHVKVTVNDAVRTLTWISSGIVSVSGSLTNGDIIRIYRDTPKDTLYHDYSDGVILTASNLDESNTQHLLIQQELQTNIDNLNLATQSILDRCVKVSDTLDIDVELPTPIPNNVIGWNSTANGFENYLPAANFNSINSVATVSQLRTVEPTFNGEIIALAGHTTAGIGGGLFRADTTDTSTSDNNGTVIVTSGGKRWKRLLNTHVDSDMFGGNVSAVITGCETKHAIKLLANSNVGSTINLRSDTKFDGNGFTLLPTTENMQVLSVQGSIGSFTNLTSDMLAYSNTFSTSLSLEVGDWVYLRSEAIYSDPVDVDDDDDPPPVSKHGQMVQITSKTGSTYRTNRYARWSFRMSDTAQVAKVTPVKNVRIKDLRINGSDYTTQFSLGLRLQYAVDCIIENPVMYGSKPKYTSHLDLDVSSAGKTALKFLDCVDCLVSNPKFYHIGWYGVEWGGACTNVNVTLLYAHDLRHATSFNWRNGYGKAWDCHVTYSTSDSATLSGFDTHPNSTEDCNFSHCLSSNSTWDSGFQIRSTGIDINNCRASDNYFDGFIGRGVGLPTQVNDCWASRNGRTGFNFPNHGCNLTNCTSIDNLSSGVSASSAIIRGGRFQRNLYAFRPVFSEDDITRPFKIDGVYAPYSAGTQTIAILMSAADFDPSRILVNNNDFTGYGDFAYSVPTGTGATHRPLSNLNNRTAVRVAGTGEKQGTVVFGAAGTTVVSTTAYRNYTAPTGTRGSYISHVVPRVIAGNAQVYVTPNTDKVSFNLHASAACTVDWKILGI